MKRRSFLYQVLSGSLAYAATPLMANDLFIGTTPTKKMKALHISLAQWSLHRQINAKELDPVDFPQVAVDTYGIDAVEYVNQFYVDHAEDETFWNSLKEKADHVGVKSLLMMVDNEGDLGTANEKERRKAVDNHKKWVNAIKMLNGHSIRINAFGDPDKDLYKEAIIDGLGNLGEYAAKENINVIIENHGLFSANAPLIVDIIEEIGMDNVGTLPDFGNWCMSAKWGSTSIACDDVHDIYDGVAAYLPYAKGVSAKSYDFNEKGEQDKMDYYRLLKLVKESDYEGYIGIEYEGENLSEHEGILATKALIEKVWKELE